MPWHIAANVKSPSRYRGNVPWYLAARPQYICMYVGASEVLPERPREAQRSPESLREAQRRTERPREAQRGPERPREAQRGRAWIEQA